jgi:hypothetical protein
MYLKRKSMMRKVFRTIALTIFAPAAMAAAAWQAQAQEAKTPYPNMAPLDQYLMERTAEIAALDRTAEGGCPHTICSRTRHTRCRRTGRHRGRNRHQSW